MPPGTRFQVLAPVVRGRKGTHEDAARAGPRRRLCPRPRSTACRSNCPSAIKLAKTKKHDIEIVVDRLVVSDPESGSEDRNQGSGSGEFMTRLTDSVETALRLAKGCCYVDVQDGELLTFSEQNACPTCGISFPELTPQMFSFNSPLRHVPRVQRPGHQGRVRPGAVRRSRQDDWRGGRPHLGRAAQEKDSRASTRPRSRSWTSLATTWTRRWRDLSEECQQAILYGGVKVIWKSESDRGKWQGEWETEGVVNGTRRRYLQTKSEYMRRWYTQFMSQQACPTCEGRRLRPEAAARHPRAARASRR